MKPREWWIFKGTSNFCSDCEFDIETEKDVKCRPEGYYDLVSDKDTIYGGINVIEKSAYDAALILLRETYQVLSDNRITSASALFQCRDKIRAFLEGEK